MNKLFKKRESSTKQKTDLSSIFISALFVVAIVYNISSMGFIDLYAARQIITASEAKETDIIPARIRISTNQILNTHDSLKNAKDKQEVKAILSKLTNELNSAPNDSFKSLKQIISFLDSKQDLNLGLNFKINNQGFLEEAPSFRTYLLDQIAKIDSAQAANYSVKILNTSDSVNEWAIALRNYSWHNRWNDKFLKQKTEQLLNNNSWSEQASIAYLEAMDSVVYTKSVALSNKLASFILKSNQTSLKHASLLALNRLAENDAELFADYLLNPEPQHKELSKINWIKPLVFSYLDSNDPKQRSLLERYLANKDQQDPELELFFESFPLARYSSGNFLITSNSPRTIQRQLIQDKRTIEWIDRLITDQKITEQNANLLQIKDKLTNFINSAKY